MREPRWITPEEIDELVSRSLRLLSMAGKTINGQPVAVTGWAEVAGINVSLTADGTVTVSDPSGLSAEALVFDHETRGIRVCYGGSARHSLLRLRDAMVLDDIAGGGGIEAVDATAPAAGGDDAESTSTRRR
ncbi:MAG: hypothetical protein AB7L09_01565 [Nitrospira sp.]